MQPSQATLRDERPTESSDDRRDWTGMAACCVRHRLESIRCRHNRANSYYTPEMMQKQEIDE